MRVVLDTNILVRAFASPEVPAGELLEHIRSPHLLVISLEMIVELEDVLSRERIRALHGRSEHEIERFVESVKAGALIVAAPRDTVPVVVPSDRDDDVVIATAVAGQADVVCTLDRDFQVLEVIDYCAGHGIRIETDVELLAELEEHDQPPND